MLPSLPPRSRHSRPIGRTLVGSRRAPVLRSPAPYTATAPHDGLTDVREAELTRTVLHGLRPARPVPERAPLTLPGGVDHRKEYEERLTAFLERTRTGLVELQDGVFSEIERQQRHVGQSEASLAAAMLDIRNNEQGRAMELRLAEHGQQVQAAQGEAAEWRALVGEHVGDTRRNYFRRVGHDLLETSSRLDQIAEALETRAAYLGLHRELAALSECIEAFGENALAYSED